MSKKFLFTVTIALLFFCSSVEAAVTAKLKATFKYENGDPVKGVKLILTPTRGGTGRTFTSNKKGKIFVPFVDVGEYNSRVDFEGFYPSLFNIRIRNRARDIEMDEKRNFGPKDEMPVIRFQADRTVYLDFVLSKQIVVPENTSEREKFEGPAQLKHQLDQAKAFYQENKFDQALEILDKNIEKFPGESSLFYLKGLIQYKAGDKATAKVTFLKSLGINPEQPDAHFYLGEIAKDENKFDEAALHYEEELKLSPDNIPILVKLALLYRDNKQPEKAIPLFEKILQLNPEEPRAAFELADLYQTVGDTEKAEKLLKELEGKGLKDPTAYFNQGVSYWNKGEFNLALEAFKHANLIDPNLAVTYRQIGYCYVKLNEPKAAIKPLEKYLKLEPTAKDADKIKELIGKLKKVK